MHCQQQPAPHHHHKLTLATPLPPPVTQVTYPGLASHPQHALLQRLANPGYSSGGLLGVDLGSRQHAEAFMERLQNCHGFGFMAVRRPAGRLSSCCSRALQCLLLPA
jgi:methionine-gamma-lyase